VADQTASTLFDVDQVKANLVRHNNTPPKGLVPSSIPVIPNPSVHLAFYEISLLFGGHCMLSDPDSTPVHQICHKDGETKDNLVRDNPRLEGKHKPGSFIIPLIDGHHHTCYLRYFLKYSILRIGHHHATYNTFLLMKIFGILPLQKAQGW
jgi:hypothetical protein